MSDAAPYPTLDGTQPCAGEDPELFFLTSSSMDNAFKLGRALEVCSTCPFRRPCLAYALTHAVTGIWGGTTNPQRAAIRREHGITAAPVGLDDDALTHIDIDRMDQGGGASSAEIARSLGINPRTVTRRRARRRKESA